MASYKLTNQRCFNELAGDLKMVDVVLRSAPNSGKLPF